MANYKLNNLQELTDLRDRGALFVINHSGGKDSQAMQILIENLVPQSQLLTIHADLIDADWAGCWDHIQDTVNNETRKCVASWKDGSTKTLLNMADHRGMWPSPTTRNCTSDLKRGPIEVIVRHYIKDNDLSGLVVNCMGIRAEEGRVNKKGEATGRAMGLDKTAYKTTGQAITLCTDNRNSRAGREYYQAYPIFDMTLAQVWQTIETAGQHPHPIYAQGMSRLSCMFCIMSNPQDLTIAAKLAPEAYRMYVNKEKELNFTLAMPNHKGERLFLTEITGIDPDNNPGLDGTEILDTPTYDDMDCGGWEKSRDDIQMNLFN